MDPLTAFSLVCGVIQVVDFSLKTLMKCKEIRDENSFSECRDLEDLTTQLVDVRAKLDIPTSNHGAGNIQDLDEQGLLELAKQCSATAHQLIEKLHSLKIEGPRKKRQAVSKTIKLLWEKGEIQDLQKRLDTYRNALDTQVLINLRQRHDLVSLQHSKELQDIDQKIQSLIHSLSQGPKSFEELKDVIQTENQKTRQHVSNEFQDLEKRSAEKERRARLLESLWFAEIDSREETIAEAHSDTFQWIFDKSGKAVRPWDNFVEWLESGDGVYWISGKAGSGKSTLMSFLCQDERTIDALTIWSGTKDIITPKFYFWSGGSTMQKSLEGMLRSLLWQILHEFPEMSTLPFDIGSRSKQNKGVSHESGPIGAWTKRRLQTTLQEVIEQLLSSCRLCVFIDGLDEYDEDEDDLIAFIQDIVRSNGFKVCSSSRPHRGFEDAFGSSAKLRLQDLTYNDIQKYVSDKFQDVPQLKSMTSENEYEMKLFEEEIINRAEGVFLWLTLAVKDQIRGLRNDDSPEQLQERLADLPSEIEGIYLRMLLQIGKTYRQEASKFFQMTLHINYMTLSEHALASRKDLENKLWSGDRIFEPEMASLCKSTRKRIMATCAGLLEVYEPRVIQRESETNRDRSSEPGSQQLDSGSDDDLAVPNSDKETMDDSHRKGDGGQPDPELDQKDPNSGSRDETTNADTFIEEMNATVSYVHRTAVDFLKNIGQGRDFLKTNTPPNFHAQVSYVMTLLGKLTLLEQWNLNDDRHAQVNIDAIMNELALAEDETGMPQTRLCEIIDHSMSIFDRGHPDWHPNSHWCTRWGRLARLLAQEHDRSCSSTRTSSRSSSRDSFLSAASEPTTQVGWKTLPIESFSFLSFAASHGVSRYVQHELECREERVGSDTLDYLLCCSIFFVSYEIFQEIGHFEEVSQTRSLRIVPELLKRGGNPNVEFFTRTIWREFLERMLFALTIHPSLGKWSSDVRDPPVAAIIAFVKSGADVHAIWTFHLWGMLLLTPDGRRSNGYNSFDIKLSPLSAIQLILRHHSELPLIREMCIARGALTYSMCTILEVKFYKNSQGRSRQYELSEQESGDLLGLFEQCLKFRETENEVREGTDLGRQIREFYDRLDVVRVDSSSSRENVRSLSGSQRESEWKTYTSRFQPGTMGLKVSRALRGPRRYYDAPSSPTHSSTSRSSSQSSRSTMQDISES